MPSGRSASLEHPIGIRRESKGGELAPRSLRRDGPQKHFMKDCSREELVKIAKILQDRRNQRRSGEKRREAKKDLRLETTPDAENRRIGKKERRKVKVDRRKHV